VLVIDREGVLGRPISRILSSNCDVVSLRNGREALSIVAGGERVDAILCDVDITDMRGMDFFRHVQTIAPEFARRVAFIAGADFDDAREFLERTGLPHIDKPIDAATLRELVEELAG